MITAYEVLDVREFEQRGTMRLVLICKETTPYSIARRRIEITEHHPIYNDPYLLKTVTGDYIKIHEHKKDNQWVIDQIEY